jgi:3-isopropylmalate/(R)-2-methylmalate dehydratase small subunit
VRSFTTLSSVAIPLPVANIDTDQIIPARFLKTIERTGLGKHVFADLRRAPGFPLDDPAYAGAHILVTGDNFGCGSSREHASWALTDWGITCVIAPSFGDIFNNNALKNGLLPVRLAPAECERLVEWASRQQALPIEVDLADQVVRMGNESFPFAVDPLRRQMLLDGLDDIGVTLGHAPAIAAFETKRAEAQPWLA